MTPLTPSQLAELFNGVYAFEGSQFSIVVDVDAPPIDEPPPGIPFNGVYQITDTEPGLPYTEWKVLGGIINQVDEGCFLVGFTLSGPPNSPDCGSSGAPPCLPAALVSFVDGFVGAATLPRSASRIEVINIRLSHVRLDADSHQLVWLTIPPPSDAPRPYKRKEVTIADAKPKKTKDKSTKKKTTRKKPAKKKATKKKAGTRKKSSKKKTTRKKTAKKKATRRAPVKKRVTKPKKR